MTRASGGAPSDGTVPLFAVPSSAIAVGRHEEAVDLAVEAGNVDDDRWASAVSTLKALARALDVAESKLDAYAAAQLAPRMAELLDRLGLLPELGGGEDEDDDDLGAPELVDPA